MDRTDLTVVEGGMMDKKQALEQALAQIDKNFGKGSIMRLGANDKVDIEAISTGSLGLDIALGIGGLPKGRIVEIYGPESSGKTTLALHVVAEAQKRGGVCGFIDAEHAIDPGYAKKLGVGTDASAAGAAVPADDAAVGPGAGWLCLTQPSHNMTMEKAKTRKRMRRR